MATDFVHTAEVVDAVLAELTAHLPTNWFPATATAAECPLALMDHGDLSDYPTEERLSLDLPAVFVRGLGLTLDGTQGVTGVMQTGERIRVVHVRRFDQCYTASGTAEDNMARARTRYAKLLTKALCADSHARLDNPTLTCADTSGAQVVRAMFVQWDFGQGLNSTEDVQAIRGLAAPMWAIACDLTVNVRSGG